ncbi:MAG: efflux RND transporter periplasmic adaptor subunit [Alphaproteobacteria bacterium]|nr:efflux RND transporter periplasmic adaptor subunit [Alphaproteobacteria bacterium]
MTLADKFRAHRLLIAGLGIVIVALCAYGGWHVWQKHEAAAKAASKPPPAIPVTVVAVRTGDFPVYLNGLGTVQPFDTVQVRSRVDGEVIKVSFKQGETVKKGDTLAEIDPRPYQAALDQAVAKKAQDEANLRNARLNLERFSTLAKQDFATPQQLDTQQATVEQLTAQIKGDQAMIDSAQTQLDYTTIRSPLDGRAGFRLVDPGNIVHAADTGGIVSIVRMQPISVVFTAPEQNVPDITKALAAGKVPVDALSSDGARTLSSGTLELLNNAVDQASGTIRMKASFANADNVLWPGLSVSTRLLVRTVKDATIVPQDAVQHGPDGLFVFVIGPDNKAKKQDIKVSEQNIDDVLVTDGVADGQKVVVSGQSRLQDGTLVKPAERQGAPAPSTASSSVAQVPPTPQKKP